MKRAHNMRIVEGVGSVGNLPDIKYGFIVVQRITSATGNALNYELRCQVVIDDVVIAVSEPAKVEQLPQPQDDHSLYELQFKFSLQIEAQHVGFKYIALKDGRWQHVRMEQYR